MSTVEVTRENRKSVIISSPARNSVIEVSDPGVAGPPNVLSVGTVTTGNTPEVTVTGIAPAQTLNFVIPTGGTYAHTQYSASNRWEITHNLNYKPNVTVVDSAGTIIEGSIEYSGPNSIVLLFSASFAGTANLS